ncbi:hypothetical protein GSD1FS_1778 [Bifidobacterium sp. GSD1FS]|uniref:Uncharacterized protein n=1 Tax=Bifidobacterium canis TaxID=2610880 RepID=A0A7K1J744_9BIFI|nr:hypothetical protein [Bifidobacterium canis]
MGIVFGWVWSHRGVACHSNRSSSPRPHPRCPVNPHRPHPSCQKVRCARRAMRARGIPHPRPHPWEHRAAMAMPPGRLNRPIRMGMIGRACGPIRNRPWPRRDNPNRVRRRCRHSRWTGMGPCRSLTWATAGPRWMMRIGMRCGTPQCKTNRIPACPRRTCRPLGNKPTRPGLIHTPRQLRRMGRTRISGIGVRTVDLWMIRAPYGGWVGG